MARLNPGQLLQRAVAYHRDGNLNAAASRYQDVLKDNPANYDAQRLLGVVAYQRKNYEAAEKLLRKAVALNPSVPDAHYFLARCLADSGRTEEALKSFKDCLGLEARHESAALSMAALSEATGHDEDAIAALTHVLTIKTSPETLVRRGKLRAKAGQIDDALADFNAALASNASFAPALSARVEALMNAGDYAKAIPDLLRLSELDPSATEGVAPLLHCRMQVADWQNFEEAENGFIAKLREGKLVPDPFVPMSLSTTQQDQFEVSKRFFSKFVPSRSALYAGERYTHARIRVAYLSGDLRDHAVAYLMAGVFEQHDRSRFETIAISTSPPREAAITARLKAAFGDFVEVAAMGDQDVARLIHDRNVDVLVDLGGFTATARPGIVAWRPAPVQVNLLGFAGTMGGSCFDYIIADPVVIPDSAFDFFVEKVVRLPDSYMPNDNHRVIAERTPSRAEEGLPPEGIVFCSFNNIYKITPRIFDVWMRLLSAVEGSVLWLQQGSPQASDNLRREASARGVDPARLAFAKRAPRNEDHLARQRLADLFLDTLPYNAHSTAADALWAGLPVLTCVGETFPGRVAASLLHAAGLDELVTHSLPDYEARALSLALHPDKLAAVKARTRQAAAHSALFDTVRFTRHLEAAFETMVARSRNGEAPISFDVERVQ